MVSTISLVELFSWRKKLAKRLPEKIPLTTQRLFLSTQLSNRLRLMEVSKANLGYIYFSSRLKNSGTALMRGIYNCSFAFANNAWYTLSTFTLYLCL